MAIDIQLQGFKNLLDKINLWESNVDKFAYADEKGIYDAITSDKTAQLADEISEYCKKAASWVTCKSYPVEKYIESFQYKAENMRNIVKKAEQYGTEGIGWEWLEYYVGSLMFVYPSILRQRIVQLFHFIMQLSFLGVIVVSLIKNKYKILCITSIVLSIGLKIFTIWPVIDSTKYPLLKFIPVALDLFLGIIACAVMVKSSATYKNKPYKRLVLGILIILFLIIPLGIGILDFLADILHIYIMDTVWMQIFYIQDILILSSVVFKNIILINKVRLSKDCS